MKARELSKLINNEGYIVHETDQYICVGSQLCSDLISIDKSNLQMRYALDTFNEGKRSIHHAPLIQMWERLEQLIASGDMREIITGEDIIDNPLPVYSYDENHDIIKSVTDVYGWPNTDIKGRLMYNNVWFENEVAAIERAISSCKSSIEWREGNIAEKRKVIAEQEALNSKDIKSLAKLKSLLKEARP